MRLPIVVNDSMPIEMGPTTDYDEMDFVLTEYQKIFIILIASLLFLLSVIITICVVSPICLFNRLLFNRCKKPLGEVKGKQRVVIGESKHFQLKVVPLYGSNCEKSANYHHPDTRSNLDLGSKESLLTESANGSYKQHQHPANYHYVNNHHQQSGYTNGSAIKASNGLPVTMSLPQPGAQSVNKNLSTECKENVPCVSFGVSCEKVDESLVKLILKVNSVNNCKPKGYGLDPAIYVTIDVTTVTGLRAKRRSALAKVSASFRTNTAKRSVEPEFGESFASPEFPKSIMKDGRLKIKVMDDERYANDCCFGELTIPLKQFDLNSPMVLTSYQMKPPKEVRS